MKPTYALLIVFSKPKNTLLNIYIYFKFLIVFLNVQNRQNTTSMLCTLCTLMPQIRPLLTPMWVYMQYVESNPKTIVTILPLIASFSISHFLWSIANLVVSFHKNLSNLCIEGNMVFSLYGPKHSWLNIREWWRFALVGLNHSPLLPIIH